MKKVLIISLTILSLFMLTGCGKKEEKKDDNKQTIKEEEKNKTEEKTEEKTETTEEDENQPIVEVTSSLGCPGKDCIYGIYSSRYGIMGDHYRYYSSKNEDKKPVSKLSEKPSEYTVYEYSSDYTTLKDAFGKQRKLFLGHILDKNGKITNAFVCAIENGKLFCLEGTTDGSSYEVNQEILKQVYGPVNDLVTDNGCYYLSEHLECQSNAKIQVYPDGYAGISFGSNMCVANEKGKMGC